MNQKLEVLELLLVAEHVPINYFVAMSSCKTRLYGVLSTCEREGLVVKETELRQYDINGKVSQKKVSYFHITSKGIKELQKNLYEFPEEMRWLKNINTALRVSVSKGQLSKTRWERMLDICGTAAFCREAGAMVSATNKSIYKVTQWDALGDETKKRRTVTLAEILNKAYEEEQACKQNINGIYFPSNKSEIVFHNSAIIKQAVAARSQTENEFHGGRFTGLAESPLKSVLMYVGSPDGMVWSKWLVADKEIRTYNGFSNLYSVYRSYEVGISHGAILVENSKMFSDLFLDVQSKNRGSSLGEGFTTFHVFPISWNGIQNFRLFMSVDHNEYENFLKDVALKRGVFETGDFGKSDVFPMKDSNGCPVAIGVFIDSVKIARMKSILEKRINPEYVKIVCYEWQAEYYEQIFDNVEFSFLNMPNLDE